MDIKNKIPKNEAAEALVKALDSRFFKALSEPVRIQILKYLILNGRSDIGAIAKALPQDRSVISRHLQLMYEVGILTCEKETRHMFYEVNGPFFLGKLQNIESQIIKCMPECCPAIRI